MKLYRLALVKSISGLEIEKFYLEQINLLYCLVRNVFLADTIMLFFADRNTLFTADTNILFISNINGLKHS